MPFGLIWRDVVREALGRIGGSGNLSEIYESVLGMSIQHDEELTATWQAIVRRELEYNSSDSESFRNRWDWFQSTHGIGSGHWTLRDYDPGPQHTEEVDLKTEARRKNAYVSRIVRDGRKVKALKKAHDNTCQICGERMMFPDGKLYSEVHHLKPLGNPHNGPDTEKNMIVVCPICHVYLDFGALLLDPQSLIKSQHTIDLEFIRYSNSLYRWIAEPID